MLVSLIVFLVVVFDRILYMCEARTKRTDSKFVLTVGIIKFIEAIILGFMYQFAKGLPLAMSIFAYMVYLAFNIDKIRGY